MTAAVDAVDHDLVAALPSGTVELAAALRRDGLGRLRDLGGDLGAGGAGGDGDVAEVVACLLLPRLLVPAWPGPSAPIPVGRGAVHADVADDDREVFDQLMATMAGADAEDVARAAQEWRLPVTPYRAPSPSPSAPGHTAGPPPRRRGRRRRGVAGVRVLDLSALWAGPLCTALLAAHGAEVTKVDPSCRPDGFGATPALYRALNAGKEIVDLDLRRPADRAEFEALVRRSDVLVASFSRRVLPNLGYDRDQLRRLNPGLRTLSITAFPGDAAERDWVAYGGGVHAASGLGLVDGRPRPAPVSYPDPLTGLAAFARVLDLLAQDAPGDAEVALAEVIAPLLAPARCGAHG